MRNIVSPLDGFRSPFGQRRGFSPSALFATGEIGAWYDPSDFSTLFQDSTGTTPVTAVEQPVGLMLDKSGNGNHATQTTNINRPVLSCRYNQLLYTEQFDNAAWTRSRSSVTANAITAPNGTVTADQVEATATHPSAAGGVWQAVTITSGASVTFSAYFKAGNAVWAMLAVDDNANINIGRIWFNISTGAVGTTGAAGSGFVATGGSVQSVGSGWYRCSANFTTTGTTTARAFAFAAQDADGSTASTLGNFAYIWGADLRVSNDGVGLPAYQRVTTATDYDTTGFPLYLRYNGTNSTMRTAAIDFTSTDKMSVFAGVRKLSDAASSIIAELSANINTNNGTFVVAPGNFTTATGAYYHASSKGTVIAPLTSTMAFASPITNVISALFDIAGDRNTLRINSAQNVQSTGDQGTGNYGNYPLYLGARGGSSLWFNGRDYGLVVLGRTPTAAEIANTEAWLNGKAKAYV